MVITDGIWLIGHSFILFLEKKNLLDKFYQHYKKEKSLYSILKYLGYDNLNDMEDDFTKWIKNFKESDNTSEY